MINYFKSRQGNTERIVCLSHERIEVVKWSRKTVSVGIRKRGHSLVDLISELFRAVNFINDLTKPSNFSVTLRHFFPCNLCILISHLHEIQ